MRKGILQLIVLFGLAIAAIGLSVRFEEEGVKTDQEASVFQRRKIENVLAAKLELFKQIAEGEGTLLSEIFHRSNWPEYARERNIQLMVFRDGKLHYWTDNQVQPNFNLDVLPEGASVRLLDNGYYLVHCTRRPNRVLLQFYLIKFEYAFENEYLENKLNPEFGTTNRAFVSITPKQGFKPLLDENLKPLCYMRVLSQRETQWWYIALVCIGALSLLLGLIRLYDLLFHYSGFSLAFLVVALLLIGLRLLMFAGEYPVFLYNTELFSPYVYASSSLLPSLGDLLVNVIIVFSLLLLLLFGDRQHHFRHWVLNGLQGWLGIGLMFAATLQISLLLRSLVIDSNIPYDITDVFELNIYTLVSLLVILLLTVMQALLVTQVPVPEKRSHNLIGLSVGVLLLLPWLLADPNGWMSLLLMAAYTIALIAVSRIPFPALPKQILLLLVLSFFTSALIKRFLHEREMENRMLLANTLINQNDIQAEEDFLLLEPRLLQDEVVQEYFSSGLILKDQLEQRIRQMYMIGGLARYELEVFDFDTLGNHFRNLNQVSFATLTRLIDYNSTPGISPNLFFLRDPGYLMNYLARLPVVNRNGHIQGYLYLLFKPRFFQEENIFPQILSDGRSGSGNRLRKYSYAIYQRGFLKNKYGTYPYPSVWPDDKEFGPNAVFSTSGYTHLVHLESPGLHIWISKPRESFFEQIASFSFLLLFNAIAVLLTLFLFILFNFLRSFISGYSGFRNSLRQVAIWMRDIVPLKPLKKLTFRTRIQIAMLSMLLLALTTTMALSVTYFINQYESQQQESLLRKLTLIATTFSDEVESMSRGTPEATLAEMNRLADYYRTDLNLYGPNGYLLASTKYQIYENGLLAPWMSARAFDRLHFKKASQAVVQEKVGNLNYLSGYLPLLNSRQEEVAYINLPFFENQEELHMLISTMLAQFANIYVFMLGVILVFSALISRAITQPLASLQERMARISLGTRRNEEIEYYNQDEIGALIEQYNKMIRQLEESADKLAQSEREGAWKEMARQVAHEIKNPLTPLKLNLQYLERAWQQKAPNLEETFKRTIRIAIEQIDGLSNLAAEFSNFAKLSAGKDERIDMLETVHAVYELYRLEPRVELVWDPQATALPILMDREHLMRVAGNLIKNAIQAIPEDKQGKVIIRLSKRNQQACLEIIDNGTGISEEQLPRMFMPSFSTKTSGMGLGLSICKSIIETARGTIHFESKAGEGTTFTVLIPLHTAQV